MTELTPNRRAAAAWAADILTKNPLILDTETTGLDDRSEICQIAIINLDGKPLLNILVKPARPIPPDATWIHGITNDHVKNSAGWKDVAEAVLSAIQHRAVIIYNAAYDVKLLYQSSHYAGSYVEWQVSTLFECAMLQYASFWGSWNDYRGSYAWQTLDRAMKQQQLAEPEAPAHSALGDCLRTLALVKAMAAALPVEAEGQGGS